MGLVEDDSFTVSSNLQFIEKKFSRTSLKWKIARVKNRFASDDRKILSPFFQFSNKNWELTLYYESYNWIRLDLKCIDINTTSTCTIYSTSITLSDGKGRVIRENPTNSDVYCFCDGQRNSSTTIARFDICLAPLENMSSMTVSLNMCSEENIKLVLQERINDEERVPLLIYDSKLSSDFEELYENRQLSDVTLKLGEQEFPAHKSVLTARSKVFAAMFEHDMQENLLSIVDLAQMEPDTVQDMLRYIYCAKVRELSSVEALNLYVAADRYDLKELRAICRKAVARDISINNVCDIAAVADIHNDELLIRELKPFISKNGKDIVKTEKWKETRTSNPVLIANMCEWLISGQ